MHFSTFLAATLVFVSLANAQEGEVGNPFAVDGDASKSVLSAHPAGDTPLARMTALSHTEALPQCDKIIVYALEFPQPFADAPKKPIPADKSFPIHPYSAQARILDMATLTGRDVESLSNTWRSMTFDKWAGALCHDPVYGLRFYRDGEVLFETSVCWRCTNFYIPDVSDDGPSDFGPETNYQWYGFKKNRKSAKLIAELRRHLKHPNLDAK